MEAASSVLESPPPVTSGLDRKHRETEIVPGNRRSLDLNNTGLFETSQPRVSTARHRCSLIQEATKLNRSSETNIRNSGPNSSRTVQLHSLSYLDVISRTRDYTILCLQHQPSISPQNSPRQPRSNNSTLYSFLMTCAANSNATAITT